MIPVLLRFIRDNSHRDAIRSARGANLGAEAATSIAITSAVVVCAFVVIGAAISGC